MQYFQPWRIVLRLVIMFSHHLSSLLLPLAQKKERKSKKNSFKVKKNPFLPYYIIRREQWILKQIYYTYTLNKV